MKQYPGKREKSYGNLPRKGRPWPLPECRLNEWTALINMKQARNVTMPIGKAVPFGAFYGLDVGAGWFSDVLNMGYTVANFNIGTYATHAWAGKERSGHAALFNIHEYIRSEKEAEKYLIAEIKNNTPPS